MRRGATRASKRVGGEASIERFWMRWCESGPAAEVYQVWRTALGRSCSFISSHSNRILFHHPTALRFFKLHAQKTTALDTTPLKIHRKTAKYTALRDAIDP